MANHTDMAWVLRTAASIHELLRDGDEDDLVGRYLNEIKGHVGRERFKNLLILTNEFGLSTYRRRKLMRLAQ